jgi:hypothetical protein
MLDQAAGCLADIWGTHLPQVQQGDVRLSSRSGQGCCVL